MPWPTTISDGQPVTTAWLNAVAQAPAAWQGQVNANNNNLTNINSLSCNAIFSVQYGIGLNTASPIRDLHLKGHAGMPIEMLFEKADAAADQKYWRLLVNSSQMSLDAVTDAYNDATNAWIAMRSGVYVTRVSFPWGSVGIGTINPSAKLTVVPDADGVAGIHVVSPSNTSKMFVVTPEASADRATLGFWTGSAWGETKIAGRINCIGDMILGGIPTSYPGAGTKKVWADPADGYRLKLAY